MTMLLLLLLLLLMMMMMTIVVVVIVVQIDPTQTGKWTKVQFVSDKFPIQSSLVIVYIYSEASVDARVSEVTADACIPTHFRKYSRFS